METFNNILAFTKLFDTDDKCWDYMEKMKWGGRAFCPHCNSSSSYKLKGRMYKCANSKCYKKYNVLTDTFFENTKMPMQKWFCAIYLVSTQKRGVSSIQLSKYIGCTQKTAWFMIHRIREAFGNDVSGMFDGVITLDETYVGGKEKNKHYNKRTRGQQGRGASVKTNVFGMLQVGGRVKSMKVDTVSSYELQPIVKANVKPGSMLMTDEWRAYNGLGKWYNHQSTDHGVYQYVVDGITTNHLEGYWAHFKRSVNGTYIHVSKKHMNRYCAEFDFKYNTRKYTETHRFNHALVCSGSRITYKSLIQ